MDNHKEHAWSSTSEGDASGPVSHRLVELEGIRIFYTDGVRWITTPCEHLFRTLSQEMLRLSEENQKLSENKRTRFGVDVKKLPADEAALLVQELADYHPEAFAEGVAAHLGALEEEVANGNAEVKTRRRQQDEAAVTLREALEESGRLRIQVERLKGYLEDANERLRALNAMADDAGSSNERQLS